MLKISNLEVNYGKMQVIKGISLEDESDAENL